MNFVDRIADAQDITDVFELVNEFVSGLHRARDIYKLPSHLRPIRIEDVDELSHWLRVISEEIQRADDKEQDIPNVIFELHAILETAAQKLRGSFH